MENIKLLGYYKEIQNVDDTENEKLLYFVAYENSYNDHLNDKKWTEGYNVMDGHFLIRDQNYIATCKKVSKNDYMEATNGWYTPNEYL